jgi:hypothetical protein
MLVDGLINRLSILDGIDCDIPQYNGEQNNKVLQTSNYSRSSMNKPTIPFNKRTSRTHFAIVILIFGLLSLQCMTNVEEINGEQVQDVSFQAEVQPILVQYCVSCHGNTAGINLHSYDAVMSNEGNNWKDNVVVPGDAEHSGLYDVLLERPQFQLQQMPTGGPYLTGDEIEIIKTWINEGAKNN